MANRYAVSGRSAATDANANDGICNLFNNHGSKSIYVREMWLFHTAATAGNLGIVRTSTIGSGGATTVTPDADNAFDRRATPASGCTLTLANYSTEPTKQGPNMFAAALSAQIGAAFVIAFPQPIEVPFGTGLAFITTTAAAYPASDVSYVWDE